MIILGLDPSLTAYGWVVIDTELTGKDRVVARGQWKTPAKDLLIDRYVAQRRHIRACIRQYKPDKVAIESPAFGESWSEGMFALFMFSQEALRGERADVVFISAGQAKARARRFLGRPEKPKKWKMGKPDMVEAAQLRTGGGRWNHNEADALWIAEVGARFWVLQMGQISESDLDDIEQHQFSMTHTFTRGARAGETETSGILYHENDRFYRWSKDTVIHL